MHNVVRMAVVEGAHDLLEEAPCVVFGHLASADDVVEQFAGEVFDDHNDVGGGIDHVVSEERSKAAGERGALQRGAGRSRVVMGRTV